MKERKPLSRWMRVFLITGSLLALRYYFFRAPSEGEMIAKFHERRAEFEQIRLMLQQDKNVETIGPNWVRPRWENDADLPLNISASRIALYRSRLKSLGFDRVDSYDGKVQLCQFGGGFTDTTWYIGYVWSANPLTPLVKSAYYSKPGRDNHCYYSRLEGNWYMYYRR